MARFVTPLQFQDNGGLPFVLIGPLVYETPKMNGYDDGAIHVPVGFRTDLASIPRGLWNVLPQVGRYDAAAVIHDFLYQRPNQRAERAGGPFSRAEADSTLLEAMGVLGVGFWTRYTIYAGVRIGGWKVWNRYRS